MANNEESFYYENNSFTYESYAEQLEPQNSLNNDVSLAAFGTNDVEQPKKTKNLVPIKRKVMKETSKF